MKGKSISAAALAAVVLLARPARAQDSPRDVETDHIDAADDGGPRTIGLLVDPLSMALGDLGVEVDAAVGENAALSLRADWFAFGALRAYGASVGLPLFPQRFALHGIYVHPRITWAAASLDTGGVAASANVLGACAVVGYEWTWRNGFTLRLGGGATYEKGFANASAGDGGMRVGEAFDGVRPAIDADVGWVF